MDADLQNDPADIPAMLERYETGGYDMVIGWRAVRKDSWSKRWASRVGNMARNRLTRENVRDTGCSLKVLRASLARRLPMFAGMHRFLPTLMKMHGARVAEMPVNHRPRLHGVSKYGIWDRLRKTLFDLLAIRWMQSRHIAYSIRERKNS
jgi:glycosyltransferase involved in cell wall biosynthesis